MKRQLIIVFILLFPILGFSQSFIVTSEGLRNSADESRDFVVLGCKGKSAEELYSIAKQYVMESMDEPMLAIKGNNPGTYLRYSLYTPEIFNFSKVLITLQVDASFDAEMTFKDDRIKYRIIGIDMAFPKGAEGTTFQFKRNKMAGWAFYDQKGKLYMKNEKQKTEDYFNGLLREFMTYIINSNKKATTSNNDDNW